MKKITYILVIACVAIGAGTARAQTTHKRHAVVLLKNAEKEFADMRYSYAIPFYQAYLKLRPADSLANLHLAVSFRLLRQFDSAMLYYQQLLKHYPHQPSALRYYAELAASQQLYPQAINAYQQLGASIPADNAAIHRMITSRQKGFATPKQFLRDSLDYAIRFLKLNTEQQDYSPQLYKNGLVFVSNRYNKAHITREFGWDGLPYAHIYWVWNIADLYTLDAPPQAEQGKARQYNTIIKVNHDYTAGTSNDNDIININSISGTYTGFIHRLPEWSQSLHASYNYGPLCFSSDGLKVYFTRNSKSRHAGRSNLEICEAVLEHGSWKKSRVLPFVDPAFDFYHPAISIDGKRLYFCSNKPGGMGGSDIYCVTLSGIDALLVPVSLGGKINTPGDELFPTIHGDTLYFSSDGHAGLGGLDMYKTMEGKYGLAEPVNLGYPLNSTYDDFGIIFTRENDKGFFSSNRLGTDDIYSFSKTNFRTHLQGAILDAGNRRRLPGTLVTIRKSYADKMYTDSVTTTLTGNFDFVIRPGYQSTLTFSKTGFIPDTMDIEAPGALHTVSAPPVFLRPQPLTNYEKEKELLKNSAAANKAGSTKKAMLQKLASLAKSVYFKTGSAVIMPQSILPLNEVVWLMEQYPEVALVIEGHTDNQGSRLMNSSLSQKRADAIKDYLVANGLAAEKLTAIGYGPDRPIADNNNASGRAKNRRVEIAAKL